MIVGSMKMTMCNEGTELTTMSRLPQPTPDKPMHKGRNNTKVKSISREKNKEIDLKRIVAEQLIWTKAGLGHTFM
jgi:hypothetical protein